MEREQREQFIDALEKAFVGMDCEFYAGAASLKRWIDGRYALLTAAQSREDLSAYLAPLSQLEGEMVADIGMLFAALPGIATSFAAEAMQKASSETPPAASGRPLALSLDDKRGIVAFIGSLHIGGVQLRDAQERAARKLGCSLRSVQRVWRERQILAEQPFQILQDVVKFFQ